MREDHSGPGEPVNAVVAVDADGKAAQQVLYSGSDFCSTPRMSPDGGLLAWLAWDHPNMPWDGVRLLVAEVGDDGRLGAHRMVAGGATESIFQPHWAPSGDLYFVSDRTGWWNLYRWRDGEAQAVANREADFGRPQWVFGAATYGFLSEYRIACSYVRKGVWRTAVLDTIDGSLTDLESPYTEMGRGDLQAGNGRVVFVAGAPTETHEPGGVGPGHGRDQSPAPWQRPDRRPRIHLRPATGGVSHRAGQDGPCLLLSAQQPRLYGPGRGETATAGEVPRRSHRSGFDGFGPGNPILDQPGDRGGRRELRRQHRLWRRIPPPAQRRLGRRGRGGLRKRRPFPGEPRRCRPGTG